MKKKDERERWNNLKEQAYYRDRGRCQVCRKATNAGTAHHCIYRSKDNSIKWELWNVEWVCHPCHRFIHSPPPSQMAESIEAAALSKQRALSRRDQ